MKTINEIHRDRLIAEAEEADTIGLHKIAENLTRQVEKHAVRDSDEDYSYDSESFETDVQESLWDIVVKASDFHNSHVDAIEAQKLVEHYAQYIVADIRNIARVKSVIGAYEEKVPGQYEDVISIEE